MILGKIRVLLAMMLTCCLVGVSPAWADEAGHGGGASTTEQDNADPIKAIEELVRKTSDDWLDYTSGRLAAVLVYIAIIITGGGDPPPPEVGDPPTPCVVACGESTGAEQS